MDRSARIVEGLMEVETSLKGANQCYVDGTYKGCFYFDLEGVVLAVTSDVLSLLLFWKCFRIDFSCHSSEKYMHPVFVDYINACMCFANDGSRS